MKRYIRSNESIIDYRGYEFHHQYDDKYLVCDNDSNYISDEPMSISECESYVDDILYDEFPEWSEGDIRYHEYNYGVDSYKGRKHTYKYSGPIWLGDRYIELHEAVTRAVSEAEAINNITYNLSKDHGWFPKNDIVLDNAYLKLLA